MLGQNTFFFFFTFKKVITCLLLYQDLVTWSVLMYCAGKTNVLAEQQSILHDTIPGPLK